MTIRELSDGLYSALRCARAILPACILALVLALPGLPAAGQAGPPPAPGDAAQPSDNADPPARVGRLSYISGTVSFHTLDQDQWEPAVVNYPVTDGLSFWTEPGARASLQLGHGVVRLDGSTEVDIQQFDDQVILVNVPQGSVNFRLRRLDPGETYQINTPSGTVALTSPGRFHVDAGGNGAPGNVTVFDGTAELIGQTTGMTITSGQSLGLAGNGPPPPPQRAVPQEIDSWSDQQEEQVAQAPEYVSADMPGVDDLGGQGNWDRTPDYGAVWYPPVQVGWAPYRYGHWGFVPPWGWTWIDDAPWGFAPFHYGRWAEIRGRWGWIPGERRERPVYAPALVAFVGGGGLAVSIGVGPVVGWVPLGPREVYVPPYGGSINYIRNVNVTNVTNVNNITINNINTYNSGGNAARFVNASATTVVRPEAMSSSTHIATAAVKVPPNALSTATVNSQPQVKPTLATVGAGPTVVQALGGNTGAGQQHARPPAPGPQVQAKPVPAALIKPLTTTPSATGGPTAPGPKISTPTAGAGTGTNTNANTGNRGTGVPGPNNRFAPAAGAGTGTNPNTNTGNQGAGAPAPNNRFAPAAGAGTGTNPNTNKGSQGTSAPGPNNRFSPAAGAGTGTNTNTNTGNQGTAAPGPNGRFTPSAGPGTGTNPNANPNAATGAAPGNRGSGAPGPNNRFSPAAGAGTGTNTNTNPNTGNQGTGAPGPNNRFTPSAGPGTGTNPNASPNAGTGASAGPGNKAAGTPGPNNRFTPSAGPGTGTNPNANPNAGPGAGPGPGNRGAAAPGPNNRFTPPAGAGTGTNPNANPNAGAGPGPGNRGAAAPGPNNRFTPATGPGAGTNPNNNLNKGGNAPGGPAPGPRPVTPATGAGGGQPQGGAQPNVNRGQVNAPKPPPPPPPQQGGNKNANPKCDPKVEKCP